MAIFTNVTFDAQTDSILKGLLSKRQYLDFSLLFWSGGLAMSCFGVVTNVINITTFLAMGVKSGVDVLFLALSFSDLANVLFTSLRHSMFIAYWAEDKLGVWLSQVDPFALAIFADNSAVTTYIVSALTTTFIAVVRCMCVVRPLQFRHVFTRSRCLFALVVIACIPYAIWAPVFAEMGLVRKFDQDRNASRIVLWLSPNRERVKDIGALIFRFVIPLVNQTLLVLCVPAMLVKLREGTKFRTTNTTVGDDTGREAPSSKLSARDRQVVAQVVLISAIYFAVNVPNILFSFLSNIDPRLYFGKRFQYVYRLVHNGRAFLETTNASVNFFVYYFYNSKFRSLCCSSKRTKTPRVQT